MGMCIYGCTPHTNLSNEGTTHQDGGKGEPASSTTERSRITRKKRAARQSQTQREKEAEKKGKGRQNSVTAAKNNVCNCNSITAKKPK